MMKILISLMLVVMFVMGACIEDEDFSCVTEGEERVIPCIEDSAKEQKQICSQGEWIDEGVCFFCKIGETRTITCDEDERLIQDQKCYSGDWVNNGVCICPDDDRFCHEHDGNFWSDLSSESLDWDDGVKHCKKLGGRLPTISELRTLIQNCQATATGGACNVATGCLHSDCFNPDHCYYACESDGTGKYSVFGDTRSIWSGSILTDDSGPDGGAWYVSFGDASIFGTYFTKSKYIRCIKIE